MKKALLLSILALVLALPFVVSAAPTSDVNAGTVITATGTENTLNYTDTYNNTKTPVNTADITTTVTAEYGFSGIGAPASQDTEPGQAVVYSYYVTNEGNAGDVYNLAITSATPGGSPAPSNWVIAIRNSGNTDTISTLELAEDAVGDFKVRVTPSSTQAEAMDGTYYDVVVKASTSKTPVGVYTGANGTNYGGTKEVSDETRTTIKAAKMAMSRTAIVDAPATGAGKYTGGIHDAVPGSIITYSILATNEGGAAASKVVIVDKVPNPDVDTIGAHIGRVGTDVSANVNITAPAWAGTISGWTAYYSTNAAADKTYDVLTDWVTVETVPGAIPSDAKLVKFRKATVAQTEWVRITWGVIIK